MTALRAVRGMNDVLPEEAELWLDFEARVHDWLARYGYRNIRMPLVEHTQLFRRAIEFDGLRLITWRGASRADQGLPFAREAALAKRLGTDKGMQIGLDGVQLLGGHGYTKEHPVERWYRDLRAIGVAEGVVVI